MKELRVTFKGDSGSNSESSEDLKQLVIEGSLLFERLIGLSNRISMFIEEDKTPIQTFILSYLKQFETVLLFIRATRDRH